MSLYDATVLQEFGPCERDQRERRVLNASEMIGEAAHEPIGPEVAFEVMIGELDGRPGMFVLGKQCDMLSHKHFHADEHIEHRVHAGFVLRGGS